MQDNFLVTYIPRGKATCNDSKIIIEISMSGKGFNFLFTTQTGTKIT